MLASTIFKKKTVCSDTINVLVSMLSGVFYHIRACVLAWHWVLTDSFSLLQPFQIADLLSSIHLPLLSSVNLP